MTKKFILLSILFFVYNNSKSQIYQPFIFINNVPLNYDMPRQVLAQNALEFYNNGNNDSSIFYYKKLLEEKPDYYQGYFNISKAYAKQYDYRNVIDCLRKYVTLSKENCNCAFLTETNEFKPIEDSSSFLSIKDSCCYHHEKYAAANQLKQPSVLLRLQYLVGIEQEIFGNSNYWQGDKPQGKNLLKVNFKEFAKLIDTTDLPDENDIGKGIGLVQLIVLHTDYYPNIQFSLGKKIMASEKKGYNPKKAAYIIDRSLRNLNKPQLYGTLTTTNDKDEKILYQYDDLEKLKKRREELKMQTVEEYFISNSITK